MYLGKINIQSGMCALSNTHWHTSNDGIHGVAAACSRAGFTQKWDLDETGFLYQKWGTNATKYKQTNILQ